MESLTYYKLNFLVPVENVDVVKKAIFETGAGQLGKYKHCAWQCLGLGQYIPSTESNPTRGQREMLNKVGEYRVEILCSEKNIRKAVQALKEAHPYEKPAYEVLKLENF